MNIFGYVRQQETGYETETVAIAGKDYNQKQRLIQAELASLAEYEEDNSDVILGELVYDDIITDAVEKEAQIIDFDTRHLDVTPEKPTEKARFQSMIIEVGLRDQMKADKTGKFFNKVARTYSKYGGVLVKKTEDGPTVVPWHNVITDQTDILSGVIIEKHYYTPSELKAKGDIWENVDEAILLAEESKEDNKNSDRKNDTQGHYIEVHEIHGELPESVLKENGDPLTFKRVFMVIAGVNSKDDNGDELEEGVILYDAEERENPYKYIARDPIDGLALGRGLYEELAQQQKAHNFLFNEELRMVAIAGKIYAKTNKAEIPENVADFDHLTVFKLNDDEYFELASAIPTSLPGFRDLRLHIENNKRNISGMHEAISGEEGKSNKPLGLHQLQNIEGHSRFRPVRQEIGFFLEEVIVEWTLPKVIKRLKQKNEIYTMFSDQQLIAIDRAIMNNELSKKFTEMTLEGEVITPERFAEIEQEVAQSLRDQGKRRMVKNLSKFLTEDVDVRITFTDESFDKSDFFQTRVSFAQLLGPEHPWTRAMIRKAMDEAGITPEELAMEEEQVSQTGATPPQGSARGVELPDNEEVAPAQKI